MAKVFAGVDYTMARIQKTGQTQNIITLTSPLETSLVITKVMQFLQLFMCETLAKRIMSMILIAVGMPNERVTELTGLCDRSVRALRKIIATGDVDGHFTIGAGGRKRKLVDVEADIIEEINNSNYHSRQEIADMIQERYKIKVSLPVVGRLLKKTESNA